jgi:hypothetical protein
MLISFVAVVVLMYAGFSILSGPEIWIPIVVASVIAGMGLGFAFDEEEDMRRQWQTETETNIQRPQEEMRKALGRFPTTEQLKEYTSSHLWFRQPYCIAPSEQHCKYCSCRKMKETSYRVGYFVVKGDGFVADCRGRPPIEIQTLTVCSQCKWAIKHRCDDFFDCGFRYVRWGDSGVPDGKNIYVPLYYPVREGCPYFEKTRDPKMLAYNEACEREVFAWWDAMKGERQIDLDERYGKDNT